MHVTTVILNGAALNVGMITRELIGLYFMSAFLAFVLSSNSTLLTSALSLPDQMKSPFDIPPSPVQRTSEIPMISYLNLLISYLSNSSFPVAPNV